MYKFWTKKVYILLNHMLPLLNKLKSLAIQIVLETIAVMIVLLSVLSNYAMEIA